MGIVIQKSAEATGNFVGNKIANQVTKIWDLNHRIIQEQLQINMTKEYLKKDIYLQKKDGQLLMI